MHLKRALNTPNALSIAFLERQWAELYRYSCPILGSLIGVIKNTYQPTSILKAHDQIQQEAVLQNVCIIGCPRKFADCICESGNRLI